MTKHKSLLFSIFLSISVSSCAFLDLNLNYFSEDTILVNNQFNEKAYLMAFPDVANILKDSDNIYGLKTGYHHFKIIGENEGRINYQVYIQAKKDIIDGFDENTYLLAFSDISNTIKNPNNIYGFKSGYEHYIVTGKNEGRLNNPLYIQAKQTLF